LSSQPSSQSSQVALANLTSSQLNSVQLKALRKEQEQAQAEAREKKTRDYEEKEQKHQADRQVRQKAYIAENDELPPCPLRCRGKECTVECANDVMYRHDMVDCENPAHANASATAIGNCRMWHKRNGPQRNHNAMRASHNASNHNGQQQPYKTYKMLALKLEAKKAKTAKASYANVVKKKPPAHQPQQQPQQRQQRQQQQQQPPMSTPPPGTQPPPGKDEELVTLLRGIMAYLSKMQL
jgi:hypothetical protein